MVWRHELRSPATAPTDGSKFMGIEKYTVVPKPMVWDHQMGCFVTDEFGCVDRLASWYPMKDTQEGRHR